MPIKAGFLVLTLLVLGAGFPGQAKSQTGDYELSVGVAYFSGVSPYKNYAHQWAVVPVIDFESERFFIRDLSAGLKFYNSENLKLAVFIGYDPTDFDPHDSTDQGLRRLSSRHEGVLVGGDVQWTSPIGHFSLSMGGDVSGHSQGFTGRAAYLYSIDFGRIEFVPQVGSYWASHSYNDYYYGVSRREALRSGLGAYEAASAFSPFAGLTVDVVLDSEEHWEVFCYGEVVALPSTIKDSPMVDRSNTFSLTSGLTYTF